MWLAKVADWLNKGLHPLTTILNSIGISCVLIMVLLVFANVVGRYIFREPIFGTYEMVTILTGTIAAFGIAYCAVAKAHVRVDLVVSRLPRRTQAIIDSIMGIIAIGVLSLATWQTYELMMTQIARGRIVGHLDIPLYPFGGLIAFGIGLLTLVVLTDLLRSLAEVFRK